MRIDDFYRQLETQPPPLILLYGEEPFLLEQVVARIRQAVFGGVSDEFNDHQFFGQAATAEQIVDVAQTFPVFAPRRLVTLRSFQDMPVAQQDSLASYLNDPAPDTTLLLIADKIDNRRKFIQTFKKVGVVLKCDPLTERELPDYVRRELHQRDFRISFEGLQLFCSLVDANLHEIHGELDKLVLFVGQRRQIDVEDVESIVSRHRADSVFELGNAIGRGDLALALKLIRRFHAANEPPLLILNLVTGHFRLLWKIRELQSQNQAKAAIARQVSRPAFVVERMLDQGRRFSRKDFMAAYRLLIETDVAMKSSGADLQVLLDQLVITLIKNKQKPEAG